MHKSPKPILSICIPAYGYQTGVERILKRISDSDQIEILISEDTSETPLDLQAYKNMKCLSHSVNSRPNGAVANWNHLIDISSGKYVWILHHDEEPVFKGGIENLLSFLEEPDAPDLVFSRLKINDRWWQKALRSEFVRGQLPKFPVLVFFQNNIGAPSNLIVRRSLIEHFNEELKWFVDVEWYFRLLQKTKLIALSKFEIFSHAYSGSITSGMKLEVNDVAQHEISVICTAHRLSLASKTVWKAKLWVSSYLKRIL